MSKRLNVERLRHFLDYCPMSGVFTWKNPTANCCKVGQVAGSVNSSDGYLRIQIDGKDYKAHRLAWLYVTGEWPESEIDHINRVKTDNRFDNLREATRSQNAMNRFQANNASGRKGVTWNKEMGKWAAKIKVNGKTYFLGYYNDIEDAAVAYSNIARILHGEFNHLGEQS